MIKQKLIHFSKSIWLFPVLVALVVVGLAAYKVSGSSIGIYNQFFYGKEHPDNNLLFGQPRSIRSDEWLVVTPTAVAQTKNNLEQHNPNIGNGEDLSVVIDTPHKNWIALFQPQNWPFFIFPVEHAFALKWWLLLAALIIGCYFFIITLMPRQKWFAILIALSMAFAPYVQWWYQSITILSLAYGFIIATLLLKLLHTSNKRQRLLWACALGYSLTCFALLQYPPFLIPVAISVAAFFGGHILDHWKNIKTNIKTHAAYILAPTGAAIGALCLFWATHAQVLGIVAGTIYPGKRAAEIIQLDILQLLGGYLSAGLQSAESAAHYFSNQSESSNFILISPFLLIPSGYIIYRAFKQKSAHKYTLLFLNITLVVFALRFLTQITGEGLSATLRIVPNNRILLGIGFISMLQLIVLAREQQNIFYPKRLRKWGTILATLTVFYVGWRINRDYPGYVNSSTVLMLATTVTAIFYLFIKKRLVAAAFLLFAISFFATYKVNPLYIGLSPLIDSPLSKSVEEINATEPGAWIILDSLEYNTYLPAQGIRTISGVYQYPQFDLWQKIDPEHKHADIYNRYAQAVFSEYAPAPMYLVQNDMFHIKFDGCDPFVQKEAKYILSVHPTKSTCLTELHTLELPNKTFYIYRTTHR